MKAFYYVDWVFVFLLFFAARRRHHSPSVSVFNSLPIKRYLHPVCCRPSLLNYGLHSFLCTCTRRCCLTTYRSESGSHVLVLSSFLFFLSFLILCVALLCNRHRGRVSSPQLQFGIFHVALWYNMKVGVAAKLKGWLWLTWLWVVGFTPCWGIKLWMNHLWAHDCTGRLSGVTPELGTGSSL